MPRKYHKKQQHWTQTDQGRVVHGLIDADIGARSLDESEVRALRKLGEMCNQYTPTSRRIDAA